MRDNDLKRLEKPYSAATDGRPDSDFAAALGLRLSNLRRLDAAVRGDLDFNVLGIGWWRPDDEAKPHRQQRILVSDYLVAALDGVEANLVDLALSFLELQGAWEEESAFIKDAYNTAPGQPPMKSPPRTRPLDDLVHARVDLHTNGVFRAAGSVLDCLASVVVGVAAFETNILRADWGGLMRILQDLETNDNDGRRMQVAVRDEVQRLLSTGGNDWDQWSNDYRNMLVHRGQRLKLSWLKREVLLVDAKAKPIVKAIAIQLLCRDPDLSEIEAFALHDKGFPVFSENAEVTINGLVREVERLVDELAAYLVTVWEQRRGNPLALPQPVHRQWPQVRRRARRKFVGYKPGETQFEPGALTMNPRFVNRLRAAGLEAGRDDQVWDGVGSIDPAALKS